MKRVLVFLASVALAGCVHNPYALQQSYLRDDLYCWHLGQDNIWHVQGLANVCPINTPKGNVHRLYP